MSVEFLTEWPPPQGNSFGSDSSPPENNLPSSESDSSGADHNLAEIRRLEKVLEELKASSSPSRKKPRNSKLPSSSFLPARTAVSIWWKQQQQLDQRTQSHCSTLNSILLEPRTKIFLVEVLISMLKHTQNKKSGSSGSFYYNLATYYVELNEPEQALEAVERGCKLMQILHIVHIKNHLKFVQALNNLDEEENNNEALWLLERIRAVREFEQKNAEDEVMKKLKNVERVHCSQLNLDEFKARFVKKGIPVIIEGLLDQVIEDEKQFTLEMLSKTCGEKRAPLKRLDPSSTEWARLSSSSSLTSLQDFFNSLLKNEKEVTDYLFDHSLPLHLPELNKLVSIPKYFRHNYLTRTSDHALYRHSWPSLFVGARGSKCGLHVDAFASHFWMIVISGTKRWTLFHRDQVAALKPTFGTGLDPVFEATVEDEVRLEPVQFDLKRGDTLFVPWGTPHRVENLETSVALSGNFVDESNVDQVVKHLRRNAIVDPRAAELLKELVFLKLISENIRPI